MSPASSLIFYFVWDLRLNLSLLIDPSSRVFLILMSISGYGSLVSVIEKLHVLGKRVRVQVVQMIGGVYFTILQDLA